ncbi:RiPP maturation radical SAM C-methyltransferase [Paraburkholderia mimosarum]|uniref:RiPP maturation radical SAM C-methyltransferase n=1 Tax=Paraburkholderia mimosarum TaxID=312026 RepID=UPI00138E37D8|nr:RiPP maturation radical SAM C-methyltransferase [Paraburkholderia mimosarum]
MPWNDVDSPSIQIGTLAGSLKEKGLPVDTRHYNVWLLDHLMQAGFDGKHAFGLDDYVKVGWRYGVLGLGEWLFAAEAGTGARVDAYERFLGAKLGPAEARKWISLRRHIKPFIAKCAADVVRLRPALVGFSIMHSQTTASAALAREIKRRLPGTVILVGGASCDGPMGRRLLEMFDCFDFAIRGEAEDSLPELVSRFASGRPLEGIEGLISRLDDSCADMQTGSAPRRHDLAHLPLPDYAEYFDRIRESVAYPQILPRVWIPFESSRGCWWGAKHHCTFCGLNRDAMTFRRKPAGQVVRDLQALSAAHRHLRFAAVDNILDSKAHTELLPALSALSFDFNYFYEVKSGMTLTALRMLRDAGVTRLQPGMESLDTAILSRMRKGVSAQQNIRMLKWAKYCGIELVWNIIYGIPGEDPRAYERMASLVPALVHLQPPSLSRLRLDRFSPYFTHPKHFGLKEVKPAAFYSMVYGPKALDDIAYFFDFKYDDEREPEVYSQPLREALAVWTYRWALLGMEPSLTYRTGPGFCRVDDTRGDDCVVHELDEDAAVVLEACASGAKTPRIARALESKGRRVPAAALSEHLMQLTQAGLLHEEEGSYLCLALPANAGFRETAHELVSIELTPMP